MPTITSPLKKIETKTEQAPPISDCNGVNPEWVSLAMPWAAHLKKACPTAYTFPYDDQTSTFTCFDGDGPGSEDYVNTQSCEFFCFNEYFDISIFRYFQSKIQIKMDAYLYVCH